MLKELNQKSSTKSHISQSCISLKAIQCRLKWINKFNGMCSEIFTRESQGVVYCILMEPCGKVHIGETGRTLKTRVSKHRNALKNLNDEKSGMAEHCLKCFTFLCDCNANNSQK
uniref:GIY-YIG domain-containing protein n=1 Tax=Romanomermis culicivorax TaxID=13658 RepID=A0A915II79_ROMCU